jgi:hypothetical protein
MSVLCDCGHERATHDLTPGSSCFTCNCRIYGRDGQIEVEWQECIDGAAREQARIDRQRDYARIACLVFVIVLALACAAISAQP